MTKLPVPRCLLFDLDGTLVDSVADLSASANVARASYGLEPLPESTIGSFVGDGATMLIRRTFADASFEVDIERALERFRVHYAEHCLERTVAYPGVVETLSALHPLPMAVVSNKPQAMCETIVTGLGLDRWITVVVGARKGLPVKPDPALLRIAVAALGHPAGSDPAIWMIGDSRNDVRSGQALGATTVAVRYGIGDVDAIEAPPATRTIDHLVELIALVEQARQDA